MSVTAKCAAQIRAGIKAGEPDAVIARRVGVQPQTVADFRAGKKTARTTIRKGG